MVSLCRVVEERVARYSAERGRVEKVINDGAAVPTVERGCVIVSGGMDERRYGCCPLAETLLVTTLRADVAVHISADYDGEAARDRRGGRVGESVLDCLVDCSVRWKVLLDRPVEGLAREAVAWPVRGEDQQFGRAEGGGDSAGGP